jgi:hypothetical protein
LPAELTGAAPQASHAIYVSKPKAVAALIEAAPKAQSK